MSGKRILMVLTSNDKLGETGQQTGWYLPEVAHPHDEFTKAGFQLTYASIKGGVAPLDKGSVEASPDEVSQQFFKNSLQLTEKTVPIAECKAGDYDAIFYAGGFGTMWDFPDCKEASQLAGEIYDAGGIVSAVCHGPSALVNIRTKDGKLLVAGKRVTAFTNAEEDAVQRRTVVPWTCEDKLAELGATFVDGGDWQTHVQVDGRLMTGQNPASAGALAQAIIKALSPKQADAPKFYYSGIAGRGELSRLIGVVGELEMEETASVEDRASFGSPSGLPVLEHNGMKIAQSCVIEQYLTSIAPKYAGLTKQQLAIDGMFGAIKEDILAACAKIMFGDKTTAPVEVPKVAARWFPVIEGRVPAEGFINGLDIPTAADLALLVVVKAYMPFGAAWKAAALTEDQVLDGYPKIQGLVARTAAFPSVKAYLAATKTMDAAAYGM